MRFLKVVGFGIIGFSLVYAGQAVLAVLGAFSIPDSVANILALIVAGIAASLQKAWNIAEKAAAYGVELPDQPGAPNVLPTQNDETSGVLPQ